MNDLLLNPWPWYVAGPLIGLMVPTMLLIGNKNFGVSSSMKHICAACLPSSTPFFKYDWKKESWSIIFVLGIILGGFIGGVLLYNPNPIQISESTIADLNKLGIHEISGLLPEEIFNSNSLLTLKGFILIVVGGFLVGFGTRYANGCTSGHTINGLSNLQWSSLVATCSFFIGGLLMTWIILPLIMKL